MELPDLPDYIIFCDSQKSYVTLSRTAGGDFDWALTPHEHRGYPMLRSRAEQVIADLNLRYGGDKKYTILPRQKTVVTLTCSDKYDIKPVE